MPDLPSLPLFHPLSLIIRLKCYSKPLPSSSSTHPQKFKFPLPPTTTSGLSFDLACQATVSTSPGHTRERIIPYESMMAGFENSQRQEWEDADSCGGGGSSSLRALESGDWRKNASVDVDAPVWIPGGPGSDLPASEGRWSQKVTYQTSVVLRCPPTFESRLLKTAVSLQRVDILRGLT